MWNAIQNAFNRLPMSDVEAIAHLVAAVKLDNSDWQKIVIERRPSGIAYKVQ